jgi:hypothetical protein
VVYEKPIVTAYELFLTALFKHYSASGSGNGPALAPYINHIQVGLSSGGENYPYCSTMNAIPQADWPGANNSVPSGYIIRPSVGNAGGWVYYAQFAGTTGGTEPGSWCQAQSCGTADGTVHWFSQATVAAGSSGNQMWPGIKGQSLEPQAYTDNGYLAKWANGDGTGYVQQMMTFIAGLGSPIPVTISAHSGPPNNLNNIYPDVESQLAAQSTVGFGMQSVSILDPITYAAETYPTTRENWAQNFLTFKGKPVIKHLQTQENFPGFTGFAISSIVVTGCPGSCAATINCSVVSPTCDGYATTNILVFLSGTGSSILNGSTQEITGTSANTLTFTPQVSLSNGTYSGGNLWAPGYPPITLPFSTQHNATEMELHECQLDYIYNVITTPAPQGPCGGLTGPDSAMQANIANFLNNSPSATSTILGTAKIIGTGSIK